MSLQNEEYEMLSREGMWDPKLYLENAMGELKESMWYIVSYNENGEATVYQRRRVKGAFFERMELNQFPFDTQVSQQSVLHRQDISNIYHHQCAVC